MRLSLLQRYIFLELFKFFSIFLSILTVLLVFVGVFQEVKASGLGVIQIVQILPYIVPSLLPFTIPATLLLTVCVVYGRIAANQEVTAAKAAGVNLWSLLCPSLVLSILLSVLSLFLTDKVIPWSMANIQAILSSAMEDIFLEVLRTQNQMTLLDQGTVIVVEGVDGKRLIRPNFRYAPPGKKAVTVQADEATMEFDLDRQQVFLNLVHGFIDIPGERKIWFVKERRAFPMSQSNAKPKPRHLTIQDITQKFDAIWQERQKLVEQRDITTAMALAFGDFDSLRTEKFDHFKNEVANQTKEIAKLRTELHSRFALSCSCFFFSLLGGPFAILFPRRQFLSNFIMCFGPIVGGYYPIVLGMQNLAKTGTVNPAWAMWVGNLLVLLIAGFVLRRALRN